MKPVTPAYIASLVNFHSNVLKPDWHYQPGEKDMRTLQVLGAARICNILSAGNVALLADEVGMGKTIQALTVCAALWNVNPKARVLVIAPRTEVAQNWEKEYRTFIHHHYRLKDNVVKTVSGEQPVKEMQYCENLYQLVQKMNEGWGQLFVGKISSFSSLLSQKDVDARLESVDIKVPARIRRLVHLKNDDPQKSALNRETAMLIKQRLDELSSKPSDPCFDLLIVDEAHYLRHKDGDTLRAESAKIILGDRTSGEGKPLAKKVLLLTATPNHSGERDIYNIVSYFTNRYANGKDDYSSILQEICVRRLRRLSTKAKNKYEYRREIPSPSDFKENPLGELFFGLYQHELAHKIIQEDTNARGTGGVSRLMKYLEGVEFISASRQAQTRSAADEEEAKKNATATDYSRGEDADILYGLSSKYFDLFNDDPAHPKYERLTQDIDSNVSQAKSVVFVRRIPSIHEITARVKDIYDKRMWQMLQIGPWQQLNFEKLNRESFQELHINHGLILQDTDTDEELKVASESEENRADFDIPDSRVLGLFKIMKGKSVPYTVATYFRMRFNRSKAGPFTMFFSPGQDYAGGTYDGLKVYHYEERSQAKDSFFYSALEHRLNSESECISRDISRHLILKKKVEDRSSLVIEGRLPTLFTVFWEVVASDTNLNENRRQELFKTYEEYSTYEKEAFSAFIEKGALLASEFLVWLFARYYQLSTEDAYQNQPLKIYREMLEHLREELPFLRIYEQIQEGLLQFKNIYAKQFNINRELDLLVENWDSFEKSQPVYPYSAHVKNQKVLKCFNTPFFPDVLVATSVLQEGVNLQFFCDTIHHYGMAWTPGDNEQRNGRIDRMFGKIERNLERKEDSTLNIYYPYLKDTVDEEQLARFVRKKYRSEELIDQGKVYQDEPVDILESEEMESWKRFLRTPNSSRLADPYPVNHEVFHSVQAPVLKKVEAIGGLSVFYDYVTACINNCTTLHPEIFKLQSNDGYRLLADVTLEEGRKQPAVVELLHDPIGSGYAKDGRAVYCLTLSTPFAGTKEWKLINKCLHSAEMLRQIPFGVKLCYDESQPPSSHWGIYLRYDLPFFITDLNNHHLHPNELQACFMSLVNFADGLERFCFEGRDFKVRKEGEQLSVTQPGNNRPASSRLRNSTIGGWHYDGEYLILEKKLSKESQTADLKMALIKNHQYSYVRLMCTDQDCWVEVSHLAVDAQTEELELLERHLAVAYNRLDKNTATR